MEEKEQTKLLTEKQERIDEISFLNRIFVSAQKSESLDGICEIIAKEVSGFYTDSIVAVSLYDNDLGGVRIRAIEGVGKKYQQLAKILGKDPKKMVFDAKQLDKTYEHYTSGSLIKVEGGLSELMTGQLPEFVCRNAEKLMSVTSVHTAGFKDSDMAKGGIVILMRNNKSMPNPKPIEAALGYVSELLKRKLAENETKKNEKVYQAIIQSSFDGFWICDTKGKVLDSNDAFCNLLGYSKEELLKLSISEFEAIENPEDTKNRIQKIVRTGSDRFESKHRTKTGEIKIVENKVSYLPINEGQFYVFTNDITQKRIDEIKLQESEAKYKTLTESSQDHIFNIGTDLRVIYVNRKAAKAFHSNADEIVGKHIRDIFPPQIAESQIKSLMRVIKSGESYSVVTESAFPGGSVWLDTTLVPIKNENDEVVSVMGVSRDVTVTKNAENEIAKRENRFSSLINAVSSIVWRTAGDGSVDQYQAGWGDFTGQDFEAMKGWAWLDAIHPDDREYTAEKWMEAVNKKSLYEIEHRLQRHDGTYRFFSVKGVPILSETGEIDEWIGTHTDITERKVIEHSIIAEKEFSESVLDALPGIFYLFDQNGKFVRWNKTLSDLSGFSYDQIAQKSPLEFIAANDREKVANAIQTAFVEGEAFVEAEFKAQNDKNIPFYFTGKRVIMNNEPLLLGVGTDISEQKRAVDNLAKSEQKFKNLYESVSIPLCFVREDGTIESFNTRFTKLFGYTNTDIPTLDDWWIKAYPEKEYREWVVQNWNTAVQNSIEQGIDIKSDMYNVTCKNGKIKQIIIAGITVGTDFLATFIDVTEQKLYEKKIIESELKFRNLIDNSPLPKVITNLEGNVEFTNKSFLEVLGYTPEDIPNIENWWPLAYPDKSYRDEIQSKWDKAMEIAFANNEPSEPVEASIRCKNGEDRFFAIIGNKIGDEMLVIFTDLTDRIKAEEERDRFFTVSLDLLCIAGTDGYFKRLNPAWYELLGWTTQELTSKPFLEFVHPDDVAGTLKEVEKLSTGVPTISFTNRYRCKDGTYKWLTWNTAPFGDILYAAATDVTDLKIAQDKIIDLNKRLNFALDGGEVGVWEWNLKNNALVWDNRMELMFGVELNSFEGDYEGFRKRLHPDDIKPTEDALEKALRGKQPFDIIYRVILRDKSVKYINGKALLIKDNVGENIKMIGVCIDVTNIKNAQHDLLQTTEELQRSNYELEQFAYVASHDLKEPLRMVSSYTQLLERRYKDKLDDKAQKFIAYAVDGAKRMQTLIDDLLQFSRVATQGKEFEKADANSILSNVQSDLEYLINESKAVITNDKLPEIYADKVQIERVFQNLISNAIKFRKKDQYPLIHISATEDKNNWVFSVKDNGIGIHEDFNEKVFIIFQRLHSKDEYEGTGIGLAVSKKIIARHGGKLWFESQLGKGTTFYFTLPIKKYLV